MFYDLRIIPSEDFLRLDAHGQFDINTSRQLLGDLVRGVVHSGLARVLIDTRKATTQITAPQVLMLAQVCAEISPEDHEHRIAILNAPKDDVDRGQILAEIAGEHGWNIRVFKEFEPAFEWLVGADRSLGIRTMEEGLRGMGGAAP